ncbi:CYTH and CHAD domain-containing protein [Arthrobacter subterraneus]|nr:CYTH and CHAD domain-containing protein [Arthrobacter subterraneus]
MPPTHVVEIERKFEVSDGAALPPLQGLPGVAQVDQPDTQILEAEYFDTRDLRLASEQITLRRRRGGDDAGWHLKLPGAGGDRHEYHHPLEEDDAVPESLLRLVRVHVRNQEVGVVARLRTQRSLHRLRNKRGELLAELADDLVRAESLVPERRSQHWREWELELKNGSRTLLEAGQGLLASIGVKPSRHTSKLGRTLGENLPSRRQGSPATGKSSAGDILRSYLTEQVRVLIEQDPQVRLDTKNAIHKMRVATRRMRSVLATYRKLLNHRNEAMYLRSELKWLAGVLGGARDAEVMHERLKKMIAEEPDELVMGPVARRIDLELDSDYREAHGKVLRALDSDRYFQLIDALTALLDTPSFSKMGKKSARKVIPDLVDRDAARLREAVEQARKNPAGIGDHPALHDARKDGKRLRYAAETASPIAPKKAAKLIEAAHGVQKILGDHQDSLVTRSMLRRLGAKAAADGENGFTFGRLHALEQTAALEAETRFHAEWKQFPAVSLRK